MPCKMVNVCLDCLIFHLRCSYKSIDAGAHVNDCNWYYATTHVNDCNGITLRRMSTTAMILRYEACQ